MNKAQMLQKAQEVYQSAKDKGRVNRKAESEIERKLVELESRVNPTKTATEEVWRWGVATALGVFAFTAIFSDDT